MALQVLTFNCIFIGSPTPLQGFVFWDLISPWHSQIIAIIFSTWSICLPQVCLSQFNASGWIRSICISCPSQLPFPNRVPLFGILDHSLLSPQNYLVQQQIFIAKWLRNTDNPEYEFLYSLKQDEVVIYSGIEACVVKGKKANHKNSLVSSSLS